MDIDREEMIEKDLRAQEPIAAALREIGIPVRTLDDLINERLDYSAAIPLLLEWLARTDNVTTKECIARALSVRRARPQAALPLIEEYRKASHEESALSLKWAIGNALSVVADDTVFKDIVELVTDKRHGKAREMLAFALGNMKNPDAVDVLIGLLDDEEIAGHALVGLRKLKAVKARSKIETFLEHPKTWVRKEAEKALKAIDKKQRTTGQGS